MKNSLFSKYDTALSANYNYLKKYFVRFSNHTYVFEWCSY